jgi:hypothetical protein
VISKSLRAAVDARKLRYNPADNVPLPKVEREEMRFLGPREITQLAGAIDPRYRHFVLLAAYTGLRVGGDRRAHLGSSWSWWLLYSRHDTAYVRDTWSEVHKLGTGTTYLNFTGLADEATDAGVESAFGRNLQRLTETKARYDPDNLFRLNNNIAPGS